MSGTSAATYRLIEPHSEMLPYAPYKKTKDYVRDQSCHL